MKRFSMMLLTLILVLSLTLLASCGKDKDKDPDGDNKRPSGPATDILPPFGDGIEGPIVDY